MLHHKEAEAQAAAGTGGMQPLASEPPPPPAPLENEDLLAEILLLIPPQPCSLPRAGLVCKLWRRVVTDPAFVISFRARHRVPPLLGFFHASGRFFSTQDPPCRVPPTLSDPVGLDPWAGHDGYVHLWRLLGCRHGFVLTVRTVRTEDQLRDEVTEFVVFDPMTGELWRVVAPGWPFSAAVVAGAAGPNHHLSFLLVALFLDDDDEGTAVTASVYSSESGTWMDAVATVLIPSAAALGYYPSTLVGDALYWLLDDDTDGMILQFELGRQRLAVVEQPPHVHEDDGSRAMVDDSRWIVPAATDGRFGLAILSESNIQFCERETDLSSDAAWVLCRTVELGRLLLSLQFKEDTLKSRIVGFAEENDVIFISPHDDGIFMTHIESFQFKEVLAGEAVYCIYPYSSF